MRFDRDAFNIGFTQGATTVREQLADERKKKERQEIEDARVLKETDKMAASDWKLITDTQSSYEDKIINEQNYKKKNALKKAYQNDITKKYKAFEMKYANMPYKDKYTSTFVPFADMEEETVFKAFGNEYVVPKSQYKALTEADKSIFSNNADGTLGVYRQGEDGKATETLTASFRRSQQKKVDAYDSEGNKVKVYEDQVDNKAYTRIAPEKPTEKIYINGKATKVTPTKAKELVDSGKASYDASKEGDITSVWIGGKEKRVKRELADKMINAGVATSKEATKGAGDYWYNPKTESFDYFDKGDKIPSGYITKGQAGKIGEGNKGVSAAKSKISEKFLLDVQTEDGKKRIEKQVTDLLDTELDTIITTADAPKEIVDIFTQTMTNMANNDPKAFGEFMILDNKQKMDKLLEGFGGRYNEKTGKGAKIESGFWSRILPFMDDAVIKKYEDGKLTDVTGSLSDHVKAPLSPHVKVLIDLYGSIVKFKEKREKEKE